MDISHLSIPLEPTFHLSLHDRAINKATNCNLGEGFIATFVTNEGLVDHIKEGKAWSCGTYEEDTRKKANFIQAQLVALDFDKDFTIDDALSHPFIKKHGLFIYTTCSHQKEKNGLPPCDRFRVILRLSKSVTDIETYERIIVHLLKLFPQADNSCKDGSRYWAGNTDAEFFYSVDGEPIGIDLEKQLMYLDDDNPVSIEPIHKHYSSAKEIKERETKVVNLPSRNNNQSAVHVPLIECLTNDNKELLDNGVDEGSRNDYGFKIAANLIGTFDRLTEMGYTTDEPKVLFDEFCDKCNPPLPESEVEQIWESAKKCDRTPSLSDDVLINKINKYLQRNNMDQPITTKEELEEMIIQWDKITDILENRKIAKEILDCDVAKEYGIKNINELKEIAKCLKNYINDDEDDYKVLSLKEFMDMPDEENGDYLIEGILKPQDSLLFAAQPKTGKSTAMTELINCSERGLLLFGKLIVKKMNILYVHHDEKKNETKPRLKELNLFDSNNIKVFLTKKFSLTNPNIINKQINKIERDNNCKIDLIILDSLSSLASKEKIDIEKRAEIYEPIRYYCTDWCDERNIAMIVIHHVNKNKSNNNEDFSDIGGASAITAPFSNIVKLTKAGKGKLALHCLGGRGYEDGKVYKFYRNTKEQVQQFGCYFMPIDENDTDTDDPSGKQDTSAPTKCLNYLKSQYPKNSDKSYTIAEIANELELKKDTVDNALKKLTNPDKNGQVYVNREMIKGKWHYRYLPFIDVSCEESTDSYDTDNSQLMLVSTISSN